MRSCLAFALHTSHCVALAAGRALLHVALFSRPTRAKPCFMHLALHSRGTRVQETTYCRTHTLQTLWECAHFAWPRTQLTLALGNVLLHMALHPLRINDDALLFPQM